MALISKALFAAALSISLSAPAAAQDKIRNYIPAIRQELARLDMEARCDDGLSLCVLEQTLEEGAQPDEVSIRYSAATSTVYIFIERFLVLPEGKEPSHQLALKLLELNRQMVTAKLEWDRTAGAIRLSSVINTDSNFDRKAFRSQLRGLLSNARELRPVLVSLVGDIK